MTTRRSLLPALAMGLLLAACSGSDEGGTDVDAAAERAVAATVEEVFTSTDPAHCTGANTLNGLEQRVLEGQDPLAECEARTTDREPASSVTLGEITIDGANATAVATPDDGGNAGLRYSFALVDDDGWKIDEITAVEIVDREAFEQTLGDLDSMVEGYPSVEARCIITGVRENFDELVERYAINGDREVISRSLRDCLGDGDETAAVEKLTELAIVSQGHGERAGRCIAKRAAAALPDVTVTDLFFEEEDAVKVWQESLVEAAPHCV